MSAVIVIPFAAVTVIVTVPVLPSAVSPVIVAVPTATPVTTPSATVATAVSLDVHVATASDGVNVAVSPTFIVSLSAVIVILSSEGAATTFTVNEVDWTVELGSADFATIVIVAFASAPSFNFNIPLSLTSQISPVEVAIHFTSWQAFAGVASAFNFNPSVFPKAIVTSSPSAKPSAVTLIAVTFATFTVIFCAVISSLVPPVTTLPPFFKVNKVDTVFSPAFKPAVAFTVATTSTVQPFVSVNPEIAGIAASAAFLIAAPTLAASFLSAHATAFSVLTVTSARPAITFVISSCFAGFVTVTVAVAFFVVSAVDVAVTVYVSVSAAFAGIVNVNLSPATVATVSVTSTAVSPVPFVTVHSTVVAASPVTSTVAVNSAVASGKSAALVGSIVILVTAASTVGAVNLSGVIVAPVAVPVIVSSVAPLGTVVIVNLLAVTVTVVLLASFQVAVHVTSVGAPSPTRLNVISWFNAIFPSVAPAALIVYVSAAVSPTFTVLESDFVESTVEVAVTT